MTERLATVPIEKIRIHPDNPRIGAAADDEMVESLRTLGLIDRLLLVPDPDNADDPEHGLLIDGHRRLDGCQRAGMTQVDVRFRDDLITQAQQIEVMAITGLQKKNLSPVEEARAYEQLQLIGYDEAAIAQSLGFSRARVKQRMRLTGLSQKAQHTVHLGQATLGDVEAFTEFADDPAALAQLEEHIGTDDYRMKVNQLRARRERIAKYAAIVTAFEEQGYKPVKSLLDNANLDAWQWRGTPLSIPEGHDGCLGYVDYGPDSYAEPRLMCEDPARHRESADVDPAAEAAAQAEREAQAAAHAQRQEALDAARAARRDWLFDHYVSLFPVKGNDKLIAAIRASLPSSETSWRLSAREVLTALEVDLPEDVPSRGEYALVAPALAEAATRTPAKVLRGFARLTASVTADQVDEEPSEFDEPEALAAQLAIWAWLSEAGYPMSTVDTELRDTAQQLLNAANETDEDTCDDEASEVKT
ncbi:ParB/RepB/Spo0J family partition protein [Nocardioides carbamazepini]|uniref:ParB/RepB/Spo0J family partition protein n=1 Tax=Nocardioides carbamazepini TaxID=2854259 RepID=UPI002149D82D|nr:ParB/RepB/Spo0J family partition protein [Nocardioides carbamazepini]MCR1785355.1 ParB/RepB/Spo0J family partition protein [Nocardioides carbamazepini]